MNNPCKVANNEQVTSPIMDGVSPNLDSPVTPFQMVLALMIEFEVPTTAMIHPEFSGNFNFSIITNEFTHGPPELDVVIQCMDNLLGGIRGVYI